MSVTEVQTNQFSFLNQIIKIMGNNYFYKFNIFLIQSINFATTRFELTEKISVL